jgi:hypothetical protein
MVEVFEFNDVGHVAELSFLTHLGVWRAIVDDSHVIFFEWASGCGVEFADALVDAWIAEGLNV